MDTIKPYFGITYLIFLLIYWLGIGVLLYHLKRFGIGRHTKHVFYLILVVSILLTIATTVFYINI